MLSLVMLVIFGSSLALFRDAVYALFSIIYGTWLYGALSSLVIRNIGYSAYQMHLYQYLIMALGAGYLLIAHSISISPSREYRRLSQTIFFFGTIALLSPGLTIGGIWDVIYPVLAFGIIFLSIYVKRSAFLRFGSLFLMAYLVKISSKYFAHDLGWPLALVVGGITIMIVGYVTYYLNKKYIKAEPAYPKNTV